MTGLSVVTSGKGKRFRFPEAVLCLGPAVMGQPAGGTLPDLCAVPWAVVWEKRRGVLLLQQRAGEWAEVTPGEAFPVLGQNDRHISLCFDQAARHVFAWQHGSSFTVRQWDPARLRYVYQGPFSGVDPCMCFDALTGVPVSQSDVIVVYLSPDRLRVCARAQRDLYTVEYELGRLTAPGWLDQIVPHPYHFQVLGTGEKGQPWAQGSGLYPVYLSDAVGGVVTPLRAGRWESIILTQTLPAEPVAGAVTPLRGGNWATPVLTQALGAEPVAGGVTTLRAGAFLSVVLTQSLPAELMAATLTALRGGTWQSVVISAAPELESLSGTVSPLRGASYDAV